jgi:hypothetical protein
MAKVSFEAVFSTVGLDKLGRSFDGIAQKMKRMADVQKSWGGGQNGDDAIKRQFKIGIEIDNASQKIDAFKKKYVDLKTVADKMAKGSSFRKVFEADMEKTASVIVNETKLRDKLNRSIAEEGVVAGRSAMIRRGIKLGLATLGVPYTIAGIARGLGEANEQSRAVSPMAARMYGNSGAGGPGEMKNFTDYSMRLRENIVDTGAAMAYGGRESIQLADNLLTMSGSMKGFNVALEASRSLGLSPQSTIQLLGTARRTGGFSGGMDEEKLVRMVSRGISETGMGPRGAEYINSIVSTMQSYSTRLPSEPDMGQIAGIIEAVNQQAGRAGAPNLRGSGAMQVTQGLTSMMDDQSEAMIAIQTEIVSRNKGDYAKTAKRFGLDENGSPLALVQALKSEGLAGPGGLKLTRETIRYITGGMTDNNNKMYIESQLLRLSVPQVSALNVGGDKSFMAKFMRGDISMDALQKAAGGYQMQTPGMAYGRLGATAAAVMTDAFSEIITPTTSVANAGADIMQSWLPSSGRNKKEEEEKRARLGIGVAGTAFLGLGLASATIGSGGLALPLALAGAGLLGAANFGKTGDSPQSVEHHHTMDVNFKVSGDGNFMKEAESVARSISDFLFGNMKEEAAKFNSTTDYRANVFSNPGAAKY